MNIDERDLTKMAVLSSKIVNSIDFSGEDQTEKYCDKMRTLIRNLEQKYAEHELLSCAKQSIECLSSDKQSFYIFCRDLIRKVNKPFDFKAAGWHQYSNDIFLIPLPRPFRYKTSRRRRQYVH